MSISPTKLRQDLYSYLDQVIETGEPLEITRKGVKLRIVLAPTKKKAKVKVEDKLEKLRRLKEGQPPTIIGDPDDLVHIDWSEYWKPCL